MRSGPMLLLENQLYPILRQFFEKSLELNLELTHVQIFDSLFPNQHFFLKFSLLLSIGYKNINIL